MKALYTLLILLLMISCGKSSLPEENFPTFFCNNSTGLTCQENPNQSLVGYSYIDSAYNESIYDSIGDRYYYPNIESCKNDCEDYFADLLIYGCMDECATNYDPNADSEDPIYPCVYDITNKRWTIERYFVETFCTVYDSVELKYNDSYLCEQYNFMGQIGGGTEFYFSNICDYTDSWEKFILSGYIEFKQYGVVDIFFQYIDGSSLTTSATYSLQGGSIRLQLPEDLFFGGCGYIDAYYEASCDKLNFEVLNSPNAIISQITEFEFSNYNNTP